jgi:CheY-like chemotaxis protein
MKVGEPNSHYIYPSKRKTKINKASSERNMAKIKGEKKMDRLRILFVEDDRMRSKGLYRLLEERSYGVWNRVSSVGEAIKQARELHPDLVFVDVDSNAKMEDIEAASRILKELKIPMVLMISDAQFVKPIEEAYPLAYILKPIDEQKFSLIMENTIFRSKLEKQFIENQKGEAIITLINILFHDFCDILSIIRGYTELSINTLSYDTKTRKNLEKVIHAADRGKDMIEHYFIQTMHQEPTLP